MQVPGEQSGAAHVQSTAAAQPAGRASHEYVTGQPPMQPGCPVSGQVAVAVDPVGQVPPSGTGVHVDVPQPCTLTHTSVTAHAAASPQGAGVAASVAWLPPPEPHPIATTPTPAAINTNATAVDDRVVITGNANTASAAGRDRACWNSIAVYYGRRVFGRKLRQFRVVVGAIADRGAGRRRRARARVGMRRR